MLHHVLPILRGLHTIHPCNLLRRRLHHVWLTHCHLIGIRQRVLVAERIQQIFLLAQALREPRARLLSSDVRHGLDALQCANLCAQLLLRILRKIILHIDADLHLRLEQGRRTIHIQRENEENTENEERDRHRADRRERHPVVAAQGAKDLLHIVFGSSNLHSHTLRAARRARCVRPRWR